MSELSTAARALLENAKTEAPSMTARAKIWSGVTGVSGAAIATTAAASTNVAVGGVAASGAIGAAKLLLTGALFGSAVTIGIALTAIYVRPTPPPEARAQIASAIPPATQGPTTEAAAVAPTSTPTASASAIAIAIATATPARPPVSEEDALMREASLVAEARGALVRGDAAAALRAVRAARRLPSHQLEPEELSIEAQALRVLGKRDEARSVDGALKGKYPDHALAR